MRTNKFLTELERSQQWLETLDHYKFWELVDETAPRPGTGFV